MLRHATRLLHGLLAVGLLLGLAPSARAAATYDVTQVGDVGFSQVWNATGNKEVKSGDTIGFNPWSVHITLEGHIDDISALAAGDVVSVPLTSDAGSHFSMNGTGWECADDVATSDGTVAFKAKMRDMYDRAVLAAQGKPDSGERLSLPTPAEFAEQVISGGAAAATGASGNKTKSGVSWSVAP